MRPEGEERAAVPVPGALNVRGPFPPFPPHSNSKVASELVQSFERLTSDELINFCYSARFVALPVPARPAPPGAARPRFRAASDKVGVRAHIQLASFVSTVRFLAETIDGKQKRNGPLRRACVVLLTAVIDHQDWFQQKDMNPKDPAWKEARLGSTRAREEVSGGGRVGEGAGGRARHRADGREEGREGMASGVR